MIEITAGAQSKILLGKQDLALHERLASDGSLANRLDMLAYFARVHRRGSWRAERDLASEIFALAACSDPCCTLFD